MLKNLNIPLAIVTATTVVTLVPVLRDYRGVLSLKLKASDFAAELSVDGRSLPGESQETAVQKSVGK